MNIVYSILAIIFWVLVLISLAGILKWTLEIILSVGIFGIFLILGVIALL